MLKIGDIIGDLKVIKVDADNEKILLNGVGFYIQNNDTGKYVKRAKDGTISSDETYGSSDCITDGSQSLKITATFQLILPDQLINTFIGFLLIQIVPFIITDYSKINQVFG